MEGDSFKTPHNPGSLARFKVDIVAVTKDKTMEGVGMETISIDIYSGCLVREGTLVGILASGEHGSL